VTQANDAAARAAESARALEAWKQRIRTPLFAADYRWDDDSAFVRIPKAVLPELSQLSRAEPFSPPGVVNPYARELMGLIPIERQALEDRLARHFAGLADLKQASEAAISETNTPLSDRVVAAKEFVVPGLPEDEVKQRGDQVVAELRATVGEERWPLVQARLEGPHGDGLLVMSSGGLRHLLIPRTDPVKLWARVDSDDKGSPTWNYVWSWGGYANGELSMFLPASDPRRTDGVEDFGVMLSGPLRQRALAWFEEQAAARFGKKEKP
jgi:hypothetical protein